MIRSVRNLTIICRCRPTATAYTMYGGDLLAPLQLLPAVTHQQTRNSTSKHWLLKWRVHRRKKVQPITLPDFEKQRKDKDMTPDELRMKLKKEGMLPPRGFDERPINLACSGDIFERYVPPEGDGRSSVITKQGTKDMYTALQNKRKSLLALRKMKKYEDDFDRQTFLQEAQEMYLESQSLIGNWKENEDRLHDIVTETAFPDMVHGLDKKTFRWKYIEAIEPPSIVQVRTMDMLSKDNFYCQITVRIHTKQTLAIYDRFGRLMYGSEHLIRDVLEYIVFEKHISDIYGRWRVHGKIIPPWMPPRDPLRRTYRHLGGEIDEGLVDEVEDTGKKDVAVR